MFWVQVCKSYVLFVLIWNFYSSLRRENSDNKTSSVQIFKLDIQSVLRCDLRKSSYWLVCLKPLQDTNHCLNSFVFSSSHVFKWAKREKARIRKMLIFEINGAISKSISICYEILVLFAQLCNFFGQLLKLHIKLQA